LTEEEFESFVPNRPFRYDDLSQAEADAGRLTMLGLALWGRTAADLERQLDAPHPEIPPGCTLPDLLRYSVVFGDFRQPLLNQQMPGWVG
jgi:hypothetical protein